MLKKENRISLNKDFDRVFKTGHFFYGKILGIRAADGEKDVVRFGVLVSTKVSKKAVIRNRVKRTIREELKKTLPQIRRKKDIVIIVFPLILEKNNQEIEQELQLGFKRLKLLI